MPEINLIAVVLAAVAMMAVGFFWYSPKGFGKQWMQLSGITPDKLDAAKKKGMGKTYAAALLACIVKAWVLAFVFDFSGIYSVGEAVFLTSLLWLGLVATVMLGGVFWEGKPVKLFAINAAHYLVAMDVAAVVLALL